MPRCKHYKPIDITDKCNCGNCQKWTGKKCRDEAELLAEYDREHGAYDHMMRDNRGVRYDT
jgi:hypothetical protein